MTNIINATPPADFPEQVIVMDKELAKRHPKKAFYLRHQVDSHTIKIIDLDDVITPVGARKLAREKGYDPKHWMDAADSILTRFY